jgi:hypothetical protein
MDERTDSAASALVGELDGCQEGLATMLSQLGEYMLLRIQLSCGHAAQLPARHSAIAANSATISATAATNVTVARSVIIHIGEAPCYDDYCKLSYTMIAIMLSEPAATTAEQIKCQSSSTATTVARPTTIFFVCAKRHPATPIRKLRLTPSAVT